MARFTDIQMNRARLAAATFAGRAFSTRELRPLYNHAALNDVLQVLAKLGEIEYLGDKLTGGRRTQIWREIKLKECIRETKSTLPPEVVAFESAAPEWFKITGRRTHLAQGEWEGY